MHIKPPGRGFGGVTQTPGGPHNHKMWWNSLYISDPSYIGKKTFKTEPWRGAGFVGGRGPRAAAPSIVLNIGLLKQKRQPHFCSLACFILCMDCKDPNCDRSLQKIQNTKLYINAFETRPPTNAFFGGMVGGRGPRMVAAPSTVLNIDLLS